MTVDPHFLGLDTPVRLPRAQQPVIELPATHHTVLLRPDRRLAAATVVDIDGERLVETERTGVWHLDPRAPADAQTGPEVYARNDLDRGHLVRRRDPCWGTPEVARRAGEETFSYANAAPQVAVFNQSEELWNGLEDYLLAAADAARSRVTVLTGPVLAAADPVYRGCALPRAFWKVAAWAGADGALASTAYLLDQSALLDRFLARESARAAAEPGPGEPDDGEPEQVEPEIGAYRTFQVPVRHVAELTGLDLGPLTSADRLGARAQAAPGVAAWVELRDYEDVVLRG